MRRFVLLIMTSIFFVHTGFSQTLTYKSPVKGLVDMGETTFYNNPNKFQPDNSLNDITSSGANGIFGGTVINVTWAELQPDNDNQLVTTAIDNALAAINNYNNNLDRNSSSPQLKAKLRIWGGFAAPSWVKNIDGPNTEIPIQAGKQDNKVTQSGTVGPWWQANYIKAWRNLLSNLGNKYDSNPVIAEISVTSCASSTDEPFIAWSNTQYDSKAIAALLNAGYTDEAQASCLTNALDDYAGWPTTQLDFPISPFFPLQANSTYDSPDFTVPDQVMTQCIANGHCILSNQGLSPDLNGNLQKIYNTISSLLQENPQSYSDFQSVSPALFGTFSNPSDPWCQLMIAGKKYQAQSIELWPYTPNPAYFGFTSLLASQLTSMANYLNGTSNSCSTLISSD